jgi:hypothetical protein
MKPTSLLRMAQNVVDGVFGEANVANPSGYLFKACLTRDFKNSKN